MASIVAEDALILREPQVGKFTNCRSQQRAACYSVLAISRLPATPSIQSRFLQLDALKSAASRGEPSPRELRFTQSHLHDVLVTLHAARKPCRHRTFQALEFG